MINSFNILYRGIVAGLIISAPVGPVNVLCISRAMEKGRKAGVISGFGAATADTFYGAIAAFSIQFIIQFLIREQMWIRLGGGILLIGIGVHYVFRKPRPLKETASGTATHSDYITAFFLNLTNPTTVLSFLAVLTVLGLHQQKSPFESSALVAAIFFGAMLWWISLALVASRFQNRLTERAMVIMDRIAGVAIGSFGILTVALSHAFV